jgi:hypothetical protein
MSNTSKIFEDAANVNIEELAKLVELNNTDVPDWVNTVDSKTVYLFAIQVMKQLHKKNLDSTKLNIVIMEKLCDVSRNILSLLTAKNHMFVTKLIAQTNELITITMGKHHDTFFSTSKDINRFINAKPNAKLIAAMMEESDLIKTDPYRNNCDDVDPYFDR